MRESGVHCIVGTQSHHNVIKTHDFDAVDTAVLSGYRHVQLRNQHNAPLEVSSLFIFSRRVEETPPGGQPASVVRANVGDGDTAVGSGSDTCTLMSPSPQSQLEKCSPTIRHAPCGTFAFRCLV